MVGRVMFGAIVFPQPIVQFARAAHKFCMSPRPCQYATFNIPFWKEQGPFDHRFRDLQALYNSPGKPLC